MLVAALECYERRDYLGAGIRLYEAALRFLVAAADWYGIEVKKRDTDRGPAHLARALHTAGHLNAFGLDCVLDVLKAGNTLSNHRRVCPKQLRACISILFYFVDGEPFSSLMERLHFTAGDGECFNDDPADWWEYGGAA